MLEPRKNCSIPSFIFADDMFDIAFFSPILMAVVRRRSLGIQLRVRDFVERMNELAGHPIKTLALHRNLWVCEAADLNAWSFLQVAS